MLYHLLSSKSREQTPLYLHNPFNENNTVASTENSMQSTYFGLCYEIDDTTMPLPASI